MIRKKEKEKVRESEGKRLKYREKKRNLNIE